ncbi:substrate-binding periplasmic protein [Alteromonas gilva]|uniref:Transporter substrate-binding domain-containing protein n=1 Tax=Alteromonas gilva TaxID=2987522 RepID=A0ABT5L360_9ALTE|nr:transporter substrate-binding domain-containing protein [Alteromonas gilva]MDC8831480.1 transporter substrate-binding domain-containing protein [Alteromonas gilva]
MTFWFKVAVVSIVFGMSISKAESSGTAESHEEEKAVIRIPMPITGTLSQHDYFLWLLQSAVDLTADKFGPIELVSSETPTNQARQMRLLDANIVDVMWSVSTPEREERYLSVDFPLYGDLFSYRVLVVRKDDKRFNQSLTLDEIKSMVAVQGNDWPDLYILRDNGFKVEPGDYPYAFKLLSSGFVDYFPRAAVEVCEELKIRPDLTIFPGHLLTYPNTMKFLLNKGNSQLAKRIETGLGKLYDSGKWTQKIATQPAFTNAIPIIRHNNTHVHRLKSVNPTYYEHPFVKDVKAMADDFPTTNIVCQ